MKRKGMLQLLGLGALLSFTVASPTQATGNGYSFNHEIFQENVAKWDQGKALASEAIYLMTELSQPDYSYESWNRLSRPDFEELVERYFGVGAYPVLDTMIFPMFARMQQGLDLGDDGPLKYRYHRDNEGFSGSAYTSNNIISFANLGSIKHPFVDKVPERARVWIHEMSHLDWVNGGLGDGGVHDFPVNSFEYSTHSLGDDAKPLASIYGETLGQYLAYCYPNQAPFNSDNVARFAMAVRYAAEHGSKPGKASFKHQCPSFQAEYPYFSLPTVPRLSPEIGGPVDHYDIDQLVKD